MKTETNLFELLAPSRIFKGEGQRATGVAVPSGEELSALMLSVLDKTFKGDL